MTAIVGLISLLWYKNIYDSKRCNGTLYTEQTDITIVNTYKIEDKLTKFYLTFLLEKC